MSIKFLLTAVTLTATPFVVATAQSTFVFEDQTTTIGSGLDDASSGSFTVSGIEISASSLSGPFNATASNFGINQPTGGDDTDGIDFAVGGGAAFAESFTLSFDQDVLLNTFDVSSFGASDEITLLDGGFTVATITSTGETSLGDYNLSSSSLLTVETTAGVFGNGWSFDSITVSAVPEPGTYALLAGTMALGFIMIRRRRS